MHPPKRLNHKYLKKTTLHSFPSYFFATSGSLAEAPAPDFPASTSLLQPASSTGKIAGRKARLDPRRAPSGPIARQTRIHSRRRIRSRRRFGQTPSQQRPCPRQSPPTTDYPMRIVVLSEHRESKDLSVPPSPPRPRPPHLPRLRFTPNEVEGLLPPALSAACRRSCF